MDEPILYPLIQQAQIQSGPDRKSEVPYLCDPQVCVWCVCVWVKQGACEGKSLDPCKFPGTRMRAALKSNKTLSCVVLSRPRKDIAYLTLTTRITENLGSRPGRILCKNQPDVVVTVLCRFL